uniref:Uncharacterized protein n=1 Tax=Chromera velia CCMP2878 TaxID=1169474 RepID=A0A0G4GGD5_9ALVE|eukprot:Cvel_4655.t1-p1 / transcript=Cvel_4655.t1 / gene=Cvel_4655 / organism=Chromera_velia_CCMP2878 / gene_product=hypothetical protein / transcript_product=hypothetical protein / location=Cvel_scaffold205:80294-82395(+) / protein_length=297 / sequence_SO=supercontig / SO=protein_coding / is_pseudo=false
MKVGSGPFIAVSSSRLRPSPSIPLAGAAWTVQIQTMHVGVFYLMACVASITSAAGRETSPTPPVLPEAFTCNFTEYTAPLTAAPPLAHGMPEPPFKATRGFTYYDWSRKAMIEERYDYCVNVFPFGNDFPCTFFNVDGVSYLISFGKTQHLPPCCIFGEPWYPIRPDFLRASVDIAFEGSLPWDRQNASWFTTTTIPPPAGPFKYAFKEPLPSADSDERAVYSSFSFPGVEGWAIQNFFNVRNEAPSASVWELPDICVPPQNQSVPDCGFFNSHGGSTFRAPVGQSAFASMAEMHVA